jgi:outer membrane protein
MKQRSIRLLSTAALIVPMVAIAQSSEHPFWIHLGPASVQFKNGGDVKVGGAVVSNASTRATDNTTLGVELGYDLSPQFSARLTLGVPPTTNVEGTGNLSASAGVSQPLAKVTYGPAVLSATWHPLGRSGFSPYVGAGLNYPIIFDVEDQFLVNVNVHSKVGPAIQIGADYALNEKWGLFVDVKKLFTEVDVSANLPNGGPAATTTAKLNPLIVQVGLSYRF